MRSEWDELAPRWERGRELLWESTRDVSEWLVQRLDPQPGDVVLDLAAGTGETGFLAAKRGAKLISSDRSAQMVEAAERLAPSFGVSAEFRVLDADAIDLPDGSVDGVLSRFGYVLKGDRQLREVRRVLRSSGRFAFAVWGAREANAWMTVPAEAAGLDVSAEAAQLSARRNPESIRELLTGAGFGDAEIESIPVEYRFANADEVWFFVSELRGPVATAIRELGEKERLVVRAEVERRAVRVGDGFALGGVALCVVVAG